MVGVMDLLLNVRDSSQFITFCHFVEYYIVLFIISMSNILVVILLYMYGLLNWIDVYFRWMLLLNKTYQKKCCYWTNLFIFGVSGGTNWRCERDCFGGWKHKLHYSTTTSHSSLNCETALITYELGALAWIY